MKTLRIITVLLLNSTILLAQNAKFQLIDSLNNSPIKYANIKSVKSDFGTSSDSLGFFDFDKNETAIINAVGYELSEINLQKENSKIKLSKKPIQIEEVLLEKRKNQTEILIDEFKASKINQFYGLSATRNASWIIGKYFENKSYKTKFLNSINVFTTSEIKNTKFNVRIYSVDENNLPKDELYSENIIGIAKKGRNKTKIDLSKTNIQIPKNGIFIAVDWLKVPENIYEYSYTMKNEKGKHKAQSYAPSFGCVLDEDLKKTLILRDNKWTNAIPDIMKKTNKYCIIAMELVLTD